MILGDAFKGTKKNKRSLPLNQQKYFSRPQVKGLTLSMCLHRNKEHSVSNTLIWSLIKELEIFFFFFPVSYLSCKSLYEFYLYNYILKKICSFRVGHSEFFMGEVLRKSFITYHKLPVEKENICY